MSYSKYYLYKKQYSTDGGVNWYDVEPAEKVTSGESIGTYDTIEECENPTPQYRTLTTATTCVGYDLYVLEEHQVSYDEGSTWTTTATTTGSLIESDSIQCGYIPPGYENQYLTIKSKGNGKISLYVTGGQYYYYSKNNGTTWSNGASWSEINVSSGENVMFKGTITPSSDYGAAIFSVTTTFEAEGNPMSLLYGDNFIGVTSLYGKDYALLRLFHGCTGLTSINNFVLPATALTKYCYAKMFRGCTSLTSIPSGLLPATGMAFDCYAYMFEGCTSLTSIPSDLLPATSMTDFCYSSMFENCTSLTSIPSGLLPATSIARHCYSGMFEGCTSLTSIPSDLLPATSIGCYCYSGMFAGCSALTTTPQLPATELDCYCYQYMFDGCTSLNNITCLAKRGINQNYSTTDWVNNVSSTGTFTKKAGITWPRGEMGIPTGWTVVEV